jgi:phosphocarrier protein HPr
LTTRNRPGIGDADARSSIDSTIDEGWRTMSFVRNCDESRCEKSAHGETVEPHSAECNGNGNGHLRRSVVIVNPHGLHMRPASAFARTAQRFESSVNVWQGNQCVNGKSLIDLMLLAAECGAELTVEVHGADAQSALPVLVGILAAPAADEIEE